MHVLARSGLATGKMCIPAAYGSIPIAMPSVARRLPFIRWKPETHGRDLAENLNSSG